VLQCVAVCCSVLQCVAVCCKAMQCVAVCNVLQCTRQHTTHSYTQQCILHQGAALALHTVVYAASGADLKRDIEWRMFRFSSALIIIVCGERQGDVSRGGRGGGEISCVCMCVSH